MGEELDGYWQGVGGTQLVDSYNDPVDEVSSVVERVAPGTFATRNFSIDRGAYVINLFRANEGQTFVEIPPIATLQSRSGASLGSWLKVSGNRVIVSGRSPGGGDNTVRIFELPTNFDTPAVQYHDFENVAEGALWQTSPGSAFRIVKVGHTNVYRQSNLRGSAAAWLPGSVSTNQGIQAEVTWRGSTAHGWVWVGLVTRRTDQNNYYFVTLSLIDQRIELKRIKNGVFATLAAATVPIVGGSEILAAARVRGYRASRLSR